MQQVYDNFKNNSRDDRGDIDHGRLALNVMARRNVSVEFIYAIASKLGILFATPEEEIIKQGEIGHGMYYISQGDCTINVKDRFSTTHYAVRLLVEGDHFGEIGLIYRCRRTCSVISRNYNTVARIE